MDANQKDVLVLTRLTSRGVPATQSDARALRRIERTLRRWAELECGDGNDRCSWSIERCEVTGRPFMCVYPRGCAVYVAREPLTDSNYSSLGAACSA